MATFIELHAEWADGHGTVEAVERDDPRGRRTIDGLGFALADTPGAARVYTTRTHRTAMTGGRGRWR